MKTSVFHSIRSYKDFERRQRLEKLALDSDFENVIESLLLSCWEPPAELESTLLEQVRGHSVASLLKLCVIAQRHNWLEAEQILKQRLRQRSTRDANVRAFVLDRKPGILQIASKLSPKFDEQDPLMSLLIRERCAGILAAEGEFNEAFRILSPLLAWKGEKSELIALLRYRALQYLYLSEALSVPDIFSLLTDEDTLYPAKDFALAGRARQLFALYLAYCLDDGMIVRDRLQNIRSKPANRSLPDANAFEIVSHQLRSHGYRSLRARMWRLTGLSEGPGQTERILQKQRFPDLLWFLKAQQKIAFLERMQGADDREDLLRFLQRERELKAVAWYRRALVQQLVINLNCDNPLFLDIWPRLREELSLSSSQEAQTASHLLESAFHYRSGDFPRCVASIQSAYECSRPPIQQRVLALWLSVAQGQAHSCKQTPVIFRANKLGRLLFAPTLKALDGGCYRISDHYEVDLQGLRVLHRFMQALLHAKNYQLDVSSAQLVVWRQTTNLQGWKQKIRNSISRLRTEFRWTLNPLFLQTDGTISLNAAGVSIAAPELSLYLERRAELLRILSRENSRAQRLVQTSKIPLATVKRILRQLIEEGLVERLGPGNRPEYALLLDAPQDCN